MKIRLLLKKAVKTKRLRPKGQNLLFSRPYADIIQIRFNGYILRLIEVNHPLREKTFHNKVS